MAKWITTSLVLFATAFSLPALAEVTIDKTDAGLTVTLDGPP